MRQVRREPVYISSSVGGGTRGGHNRASTLAVVAFFVSAFLYLSRGPSLHVHVSSKRELPGGIVDVSSSRPVSGAAASPRNFDEEAEGTRSGSFSPEERGGEASGEASSTGSSGLEGVEDALATREGGVSGNKDESFALGEVLSGSEERRVKDGDDELNGVIPDKGSVETGTGGFGSSKESRGSTGEVRRKHQENSELPVAGDRSESISSLDAGNQGVNSALKGSPEGSGRGVGTSGDSEALSEGFFAALKESEQSKGSAEVDDFEGGDEADEKPKDAEFAEGIGGGGSGASVSTAAQADTIDTATVDTKGKAVHYADSGGAGSAEEQEQAEGVKTSGSHSNGALSMRKEGSAVAGGESLSDLGSGGENEGESRETGFESDGFSGNEDALLDGRLKSHAQGNGGVRGAATELHVRQEKGVASAPSAAVASASSAARAAAAVVLNGAYERRLGRDVVWQGPSKDSPRGVRGVAFFAHGCRHKATHFWPKSATCPTCIGLPEDQKLVRHAIARGYTVIAISSAGGCWQTRWPPSASTDVRVVRRILAQWRRERELLHLPLVALGASSGGYFVSILARVIPLEAVVVMISSGVSDAFMDASQSDNPYPPTLFVHMPKDEAMVARVQDSMRMLKANDVTTAQIECRERKLTGSFLADQIDGLDRHVSVKIFAALSEAALVNTDGHLVPEYYSRWRAVVKARGLLDKESPTLGLRIKEELNVAFAFHEITGQYSEEIVDWFDGVCTVERVDGERVVRTVESVRCKSYFPARAHTIFGKD